MYQYQELTLFTDPFYFLQCSMAWAPAWTTNRSCCSCCARSRWASWWLRRPPPPLARFPARQPWQPIRPWPARTSAPSSAWNWTAAAPAPAPRSTCLRRPVRLGMSRPLSRLLQQEPHLDLKRNRRQRLATPQPGGRQPGAPRSHGPSSQNRENRAHPGRQNAQKPR